MNKLLGVGVLVLVVLFALAGCSGAVSEAPGENQSPVLACTASTAEAGGHWDKCSAAVLSATVNPLVYECPTEVRERPPESVIGKYEQCEVGADPTVWCCVYVEH